MKSRNKFILLGTVFNILLLSLSVAFSTFSWFIGSSYLEIANMDVTIASEGFGIGTGETSPLYDALYKDDLKQTDFFIPCSSMYSDVWQEQHLEVPKFKGGYAELTSNIMEEPSDTERDKGYFSQELFFEATTDCYIYVDPKESFARAQYDKNKAKAKGLKGREGITDPAIIEKYLNTIERSLRFSILVLNDVDIKDKTDERYYKDYAYYILDPYKTELANPDNPNDLTEKTNPTYYGGIMDALDPDSYFDDYEGKEVLYGQLKNTDKICYSEPASEDIPLKGEYRTCFNAAHRKGIRLYDEKASKEAGFEIVEEPSIPLAHADDPKYGLKIPLRKGVRKRVVLSIYLEGWDLDNTDLTTDGAFTTGISFYMMLH